MAGYSGTPLPQKLGIKPGTTVAAINALEPEIQKLTDDEIDVIDGKRQQLVGKIQEHYGLAKDAAEKQADEFVKTLSAEDREEARREGRAEGREQERARRAGSDR